MKGILLLNGDPYRGEIDSKNAFVVCCDGAYNWAHGKVRIDRNIGDFDSIAKGVKIDPPPEEVYSAEKDYTDGEIGLRQLLKEGCSSIGIYGGEGGREDHFLGNLHLLYYAFLCGVRATMYTARSEIFLTKGKTVLRDLCGKTVSLLPFGGDAHIIDGDGFKYSLKGVRLRYGEAGWGTSNVVEKEEAWFDSGESIVLVIVNKNRGE